MQSLVLSAALCVLSYAQYIEYIGGLQTEIEL